MALNYYLELHVSGCYWASFFSPLHNLLYCRGSGWSFNFFSGWILIQLPWYARIIHSNIRNDVWKLKAKTSVLYKLVVFLSNYYISKNLYFPLYPFLKCFLQPANHSLHYMNCWTQWWGILCISSAAIMKKGSFISSTVNVYIYYACCFMSIVLPFRLGMLMWCELTECMFREH